MPVNWSELFAERTQGMRSSDIREILKLTSQPNVISLAGGLPAPELFPVDAYRRAFEWVFETDGGTALQYGISEGYRPLREAIVDRLGRRGLACTPDDVLILNGSQQALDLVGKVLLDPGDLVALENPSYLGAIQAFNQYQAAYTVVPMDDEGMRMDALEQTLAQDRGPGGARRVKLIYVVPNFQNPTGRTMALERRRRLAELANRFGVPVLEDDPYGELRYEGEHLPSVKSFDTAGNVIYQGTFSKTLAPGFRLGWLVAASPIMEALVHAKQPADLNTAMASQMATAKVLQEEGFLDKHVSRLREVYGERRDVLLRALQEHLPDSVRFNRPQGGMFVWCELPPHLDARVLLAEALKDNVAFVPGQGFHPDGSGGNTMRLNFSNVPPDALREGARRLGTAIQRVLGDPSRAKPPIAV